MREILRVFTREPRFCVTIALVLALCLGLNSALFMVVNAMLLRPLPFPESERLVELEAPGSPLQSEQWQQVGSIEGAGAFASANFPVAEADGTRMIYGLRVTPELIPLLRPPTAAGRPFETQDFGKNVAMIGYEYWRKLGAKPDIGAQPLTLNGEAYSIAGVLSPDFYLGTRDVALIVPNLRGGGRTIARLRPGVTGLQAQAEIAALAGTREVRVTPLHLALRSSDSQAVILLLATAGMVLLIACANLANLQLIRGLGRRREFAIRAALGASTPRLALQLAVESAAIASAGAVAGLLLIRLFHDVIVAMLPANIARRMAGADALAVDWRVLSFTAGAALAATILFGALPALSSLRFDLVTGLKEPLRSLGRGRQRWGQILVASEIALALTLVTAAGLAFRGFTQIQNQYLGFRPEGVLRAMADFNRNGRTLPEQRAALITDIERRLASIPGVAAAGMIAPQAFPFGGPNIRGSRFEIAGKAEKDARAEVYFANPAYREAIGLPLLRGRWFTGADTLSGPPVAVLSQTVARRYWGARECIGEKVLLDAHSSDAVWAVVVGVAGDVKNPLGEQWQPTAYRPLAQAPPEGATLMIRAAVADPVSLLPSLRRELRAADPAIPDLRIIAALDHAVRDYSAPQRFTTTLLAILAAAGLALAGAGVYAVMRHWVVSRVPEMGLRMALGAGRGDVARLVVGRAMKTAGWGLLAGVGGAIAGSKALAARLAGIAAVDAGVVGLAAGVILGAAVLAAWLPARRAGMIDPAECLRAE